MSRQRSVQGILSELKYVEDTLARRSEQLKSLADEHTMLRARIPELKEKLRMAIARVCNQHLGGFAWTQTPAGTLPKDE